jgi:hypothetical protein
MLPWSKVRALGWSALDNGPALVGSFLRFAVKTGIRLLVFAVPTSYVAQWCDVQPTWKSTAFMTFCIIWSGCVFDTKEDRSAKANDPGSAGNQKAAAVVMTPAEVAAAARKMSRQQQPKAD